MIDLSCLRIFLSAALVIVGLSGCNGSGGTSNARENDSSTGGSTTAREDSETHNGIASDS